MGDGPAHLGHNAVADGREVYDGNGGPALSSSQRRGQTMFDVGGA